MASAVLRSPGTSSPQPIPHQPGELHPNLSKGPWSLVRLFTETILPEDFDLDRRLSSSGITVDMVPNIENHKHHGSFELVAVTRYLPRISKGLHEFQLEVDYNPSQPAEADVRIHGIIEAKRRAQVGFLSNAVKAIRSGWGTGPEQCYRDAARSSGLGAALERAILNWDIQVSYLHIYLSAYLLRTSSIPILGS